MSEPGFYGDAIADMYDDLCSRSDWLSPNGAVDFLAGLSFGGRALELGIGTGRIALPLRARGVDVLGIEVSEAMIGQLRKKPGGEKIEVVCGDFTDINLPGPFSLVYVAFNTLCHVTSQERQVACFENVARHLEPSGVFVVETFVPLPPPQGGEPGQLTVWNVTDDSVDIGIRWYDPTTQRYAEQHVYLEDGRVRLNHNRGREIWPGELDLMARLAGLRLRERWADWCRNPFNPQSRGHVSIYEHTR
jgi:SAM-dependent methyltransferase